MTTKLTLQEISELAGVSITTVSRVLSNAPNVNNETRSKVLDIVESSALNQIKKKSNLIGFLVPDINNPFFSKLIGGIESIANIQDYGIIVSHTENDTMQEEKCIKKLLNLNVDGIIYFCAKKSPAIIDKVLFNQYPPIVFLDRDPGIEGCNLITTDSTEGMYQSSKYLFSLGHRKVLYLGGDSNLEVNKKRYAGFEKAVKELNINLKEIKIIEANFDMNQAYKQVLQLINEDNFNFTAICASNDIMAFGAQKALTKMGFSVPNDVSIIGYDDIPSSELMNLTTVHQPLEEMGRTAMLTLDSLIKGNYRPEKTVALPTRLIIRNTCAVAKTLY